MFYSSLRHELNGLDLCGQGRDVGSPMRVAAYFDEAGDILAFVDCQFADLYRVDVIHFGKEFRARSRGDR